MNEGTAGGRSQALGEIVRLLDVEERHAEHGAVGGDERQVDPERAVERGRELAHPPASLKRDRSRLVDAALDAHFFIGGLKVAIGADPDLLFSLSNALASMGAEIVTAVTTSQHYPVDRVPADEVILGDLGDFERAAGAAGADLLMTHSHGRHAEARLGKPLLRVGFPVFDRIGAQDVCRVGYRGSRAFLYEVANIVQSQHHKAKPEDFGAAPIPEEFDHVPHAQAC